ncbi:MAG: hypothetical protein ABJF23_18075 [Bryobacteraceae bacterium]
MSERTSAPTAALEAGDAPRQRSKSAGDSPPLRPASARGQLRGHHRCPRQRTAQFVDPAQVRHRVGERVPCDYLMPALEWQAVAVLEFHPA